MANDFTGRQIYIDSTGLINIPCNFKVIDGWWQDMTTAGHIFNFEDARGRQFQYTCTQPNFPTALGKLDWLAGPITVTQIDSGKAYLILGNK